MSVWTGRRRGRDERSAAGGQVSGRANRQTGGRHGSTRHPLCLPPFPIQAQALPAIMSGRDVIGVAKTGSGKTLAFIVPLLMKIEGIAPTISASGLNRGPIGLVLVPTRELALQITRVAKPLLRLFSIRTVCICGGMDKTKQLDELKLKVHILVATPGRLIDILNSNKAEACISLKRLQYLIFDEAEKPFLL